MKSGFSEFVKKEMASQGISLRALARKLKVQPSFLSRVFTGHRKNLPPNETIHKIAQALHLNYNELLMKAGRLPSSLDLWDSWMKRIVKETAQMSDRERKAWIKKASIMTVTRFDGKKNRYVEKKFRARGLENIMLEFTRGKNE